MATKISEFSAAGALTGAETVAGLQAGTNKNFPHPLNELSSTASGKGAVLIGFLPAGASAQGSTSERKHREIKSVMDWMTPAQIADAAANTGSIDLTAAFSAAAQEAPALVNMQGAEATGIARAPMVRLFVPAGTYLLSSLVSTGGREVAWVLDHGAVVNGYENLNGKLIREGSRVHDHHHGTADYAVTYSVRANSNLDDGAEILGITTPADLATYPDRDSVAFFVDNQAPAVVADVTTATYTATTIVPGTALTASQVKQLRVGMIIDTKHATKYSGFITSWAADGTSITVSNWYLSGGGAGTPANGTGAYVNPFTKAWVHNANVMLASDSHATAATGFELGMLNNKSAGLTTWGFDSVNLGTHKGTAAHIARGSWDYGFLSIGQDNGFVYQGTGGGLTLQSAAGATAFSVSNGGNIEMGYAATASTSLIDFHSSGLQADNDARIACSGGDATVSNGVLTFYAGRVAIASGEIVASTDNATNIGAAANRFNTIFASNNVINTSDAREKTPVRPLTAAELEVAKQLSAEIGFYQWLVSIGEKGDAARLHAGMTVQRAVEIFVANGLDPFHYGLVCYDEWDESISVIDAKSTDPDAVIEGTKLVQKTERKIRQKQKVQVIDGRATLVTEDEEYDAPVSNILPVFDELGRPVMAKHGQLTHTDPVMVEVPRFVKKTVRPAGSRYGFRGTELLLLIAAGFNARLSALESA